MRGNRFPVVVAVAAVAMAIVGSVVSSANAGLVTVTAYTGSNNKDNYGGNMEDLISGEEITKTDPDDPSTWTAGGGSYKAEWQTGSQLSGATNGKIAWTALDFGSTVANLENAYFWNIREATAQPRRTVDYNIYYATSPTVALPAAPTGNTSIDYDFASGGWTSLTSTPLVMPQRGAEPDPANQVVALGDISARYIGVEILTCAGATDRAGLSEVAITAGAAVPGQMISHYAFDGNTADGGTLGNTAGALVGDAGFSAGKLGQALQLDGDGDYFDTNRDAPYDFTGGPLTFSFWAKLDEDGWNENWECLIGKGENAAWRLARSSGSNTQVKYSTFLAGNANLTDKEWHLLTATNTAGASEIFFDGSSVGTGGGTIGDVATDLWIGNNPQKSGRAFGGMIDDVGIWDVVLSDEWAKAMFDLAIDPAFGYDAGQVNLLGLLHAQGAGTTLIDLDLWEYAQRDPGDGLQFVPFAADGTGVHFLGAIPEPATLSLLGLGALLALRRRRRSR